MRQTLWIVLFIIFTSVSGLEFCNEPGTICEEVPSEMNGEALKVIRAWLANIAIQRPLKCVQAQPAFAEKYLGSNLGPVFETRLCQSNDQPSNLSIKGHVDDLGRVQGMAKIQILANPDEIPTHSNICLKRRSTFGSMIKSITGSFQDGVPIGQAKSLQEDGCTTIAHYEQGVVHGLVRRWDAGNVFRTISYNYHGNYEGKCWLNLANEGYRYESCRGTPTFGPWHESDHKTVLITNSSKVISGIYGKLCEVSTQSRYAHILEAKEHNCIMTLRWKPIDGEAFTYAAEPDITRYESEFEREESPYCQTAPIWNTEDPVDAFRGWMDQFRNDTQGHWSWKSRAADEPLVGDPDQVIGNIEHVSGPIFSCQLLGSKHKILAHLELGHVDTFNMLQSNVRLNFDPAQTPVLPFFEQGIRSLSGYMRDSIIQDRVILELKDGRYLKVGLKEGVLHGLASIHGRRPVMPVAPEYGIPDLKDSAYGKADAGFGGVMAFRNGQLTPSIVLVLVGGGMLVGQLDQEFHFTGDNLAFVYPDFELAYVGRFEDFVMKRGQIANLTGERCNDFGVKEFRFSPPEGPVVFYSPPTNISMGEGPQVLDPFDQKMVYLGPSTIPGAGDGLFSKQIIRVKCSAAMFSGVSLRNANELLSFHEEHLGFDPLRALNIDRHVYSKYGINVNFFPVQQYHIPPNLDLPGSWKPNLSHKVNSNVKANVNVNFEDFEHPRYGLIKHSIALRNIQAGEELFAFYGVKSDWFKSWEIHQNEVSQEGIAQCDESTDPSCPLKAK